MSSTPERDHLLLVEDDAPLRRTLAQALSKRGFDVDEAGSADLACRRLSTQHYDVVVTDLHLPGTGQAVIRAVRASHRKVPVVVITADGRAEARRQVTEIGATRVVRKPVGLAVLLREIEKAREDVEAA